MASLTSCLNSTLKILDHKLRKHNIDLQKDFPTDLAKIPLRVGQVNQVFTNLIDNAIDALKEVEHPQIKISIFMQRDNAFVKIEDNGPGIPDDLKALIFDPFFTTKGVGEGSGMGLEISRRIIEQHGGKLELESAQNPTIFSICLPSKT
jgi:signal transduction histidine kinase